MSDTDQQPLGPHRTYQDLRVVADTEERDEHLTIGVIIDGAFVPIAQQPLGLIEAMKTRWNGLGGTKVESHADAAVQQLEDRVATLERAALAAGQKLDKPPSQPRSSRSK